MARYQFSAVGFVVLDILGRYVREMPPPGGASFIDEITMTVAGTAGATAVDCAILGLNGQVCARLGSDDMGDFLVSGMRRFGLNTDLVRRDEHRQTSCSMLPIRPDGSRAGFFVPGATAAFHIAPEDRDKALDGDIIHLGGTGLLDAFDGAPSREFLKAAKARGRTTVFDLILADAATVRLVEPLLPYLDHFVPSIEEAGEMVGTRDPVEVARWFRTRGVGNVFLTLEGDGVYVAPEDGEPFTLPAHRIDVVDTTGCGDAFTAGVIVGLAHGWEIRRIARFANAVAAKVAIGLGSMGRLTSFEDTITAMNTWPLRTQNREDTR